MRFLNSAALLLLLAASFAFSQSIPDFTPPTPLFRAILNGDSSEVKRVIASGANVNEGLFVGSPPLIIALAEGYTEIARMLIAAGADTKVTDPSGATVLMWAAYNDLAEPEFVEMLIKKGADVNAKNKVGEDALTWAMRRGYTSVVQVLRKHGASDTRMVVDSVQRASNALQKSAPEFLKVSGCVSCHNQSLPQMVWATARERGLNTDAAVRDKQAKAVIAMYRPMKEMMAAGKEGLPDPAITVSYSLIGLAAESYPADDVTAAMAHLVSTQQNADGSFRCLPGRPPIESSSVTATALSLRALQLYGKGSDRDAVIAKAATWLRTGRTRTTEERAMRLLGLTWTKAPADMIRKAANDLVAHQRVDGGWGQLDALESDAYATGQAMYALTVSGQVATSDEPYAKGAGFLIRTQRPDGSWLVRTRSNPFQPLKESGFPHGRDQWISAAGTSWAALGLGAALPPASATQLTKLD